MTDVASHSEYFDALACWPMKCRDAVQADLPVDLVGEFNELKFALCQLESV